MKTIDECLFKAVNMLKESGKAPDSLFHPDYGWLIYEGKITETGKKLLDFDTDKEPA